MLSRRHQTLRSSAMIRRQPNCSPLPASPRSCPGTGWLLAIRRGVAGLSFLTAMIASIVAADTPPSAPTPSPLSFEAAYTAEGLAVVQGGIDRGVVYRGLAEAAIEADLAAAFGAPAGTTLRISGLYPHGGDIGGGRLGDLQGASNIDAYNHPLLCDLWISATIAPLHLEIRLGRQFADGDFAITGTGAVFHHSSFGWPAFISGNTLNTGPAFPRTALGIYLQADATSRLHLRAGVYDGDTFDSATGDPAAHPDGLHFELSRSQGAFAIAEAALDLGFDSAAGRLPGAVKLGAWGHTADFADRFDPSHSHSGNHGLYVVAEQMLWRAPGQPADTENPRGLTAFARTGFSPSDRNLFSQTADAGLGYTGLFPNRAADTCALGLAWARISGDEIRARRAAGDPTLPDYELVVEAVYDIAASRRWHVSPDVQWIRHPGGSSSLDDAVLVSLRTRYAF